jgi:hypothetical protein
MSNEMFSLQGKGRQEGSSSFLKKRTKKLLIVLSLAALKK